MTNSLTELELLIFYRRGITRSRYMHTKYKSTTAHSIFLILIFQFTVNHTQNNDEYTKTH